MISRNRHVFILTNSRFSQLYPRPLFLTQTVHIMAVNLATECIMQVSYYMSDHMIIINLRCTTFAPGRFLSISLVYSNLKSIFDLCRNSCFLKSLIGLEKSLVEK